MTQQQQGSEVARLMEQIEREYQAARSGLDGLASGMSRHAFVSAKMARVQRCHEQLQTLVGEPAAIALMVRVRQSLPGHFYCSYDYSSRQTLYTTEASHNRRMATAL